MSFELDTNEMRKADRLNTSIRESGKYIGTITRAEKLLSKNKTEGMGLSFKTDDGATANYLDLYTVNNNGEKLPSMATAQAIFCCSKTRDTTEGVIKFKAWDKDAKAEIDKTATGYPALIGKRIGLLLQQELSTNSNNGEEVDRVIIYGVFEADTGFTSSEILDKATQPEKLNKMVASMKPVNDRRTYKSVVTQDAGGSFSDFDASIPFN